MSVKEKITELESKERELAEQSEAVRIEVQRQEDQQRAQKEVERNAKHDAGIYDAKVAQIRLYKQLERSGLIVIVMEATDRHFFAPKMPPPPADQPLVRSQLWPSKEVIREAFRDHGWKVEVAGPTLSVDDVWDTNIHMRLIQVHSEIACGRQGRYTSSIDRVVIDFDDKKHLLIKGEEVTFDRRVKIQRSPAQTELLETALARAMHKPEIERPTSRRPRSYSPRGMGPFFGNRGIVIGG